MGKIIGRLPSPVDEQGHELTAEEIEQLSTEPDYVKVPLERNGRRVVFSVAADFDQVERAADDAYQLFKAERYKIIADERPKRARNSKFTNLKATATTDENTTDEEQDSEDAGIISGEQNLKLVQLNPQQRKIFIDLVLPCVLGGNVPGMPELPQENEYAPGQSLTANRRGPLRAWFESGGATAEATLEALVMACDPTGYLAQGKADMELQRRLREELETKVRERMAELTTENGQSESQTSSALGSESSAPSIPAPREGAPATLAKARLSTVAQPEVKAVKPLRDLNAPSPEAGAVALPAANGV